MRRRPNSLLGLCVQLVQSFAARSPAVSVIAVFVLVIVAIALFAISCGSKVRLATFNIENFPRSATQVEGAFAILDELGADVIGVQEITDPDAFTRGAREHLGPGWRFLYPARSPVQRVGVLYDSKRWGLISTRTWRELELHRRGRPAFEVRLEPLSGFGNPLRVIVVHLKAGGDGFAIRQKQYKALKPIMAEAMASGDRVVLMGDFNATEEADRTAIEALAAESGMSWASKALACTYFWDREDGCLVSRLDHVLTWRPVWRIKARGPCETEGCDKKERCPIFHKEVSDHCPVTVDP